VKLVLSDVRMPGTMDGVGLARAVRAKHPAVKILLTSGHLATVDWAEHDGYFPKPYDAERVIARIRELIG